jgi:hypothetical protein
MKRRGRPPKIAAPFHQIQPLADMVHEMSSRPKPEPPPDDPNLRLIRVDGPDMDAHYFGQLTTVSQRRRLIRKGKLRCVRIGQVTYLSEAAIAEFLASGGSR